MPTMDKKYIAGFDLGGTKMLCTIMDGKFTPLGKKKKRTKAHEGQDSGLDRIKRTLEGALDDAGVSANELIGIGVGTPGPLDLDKGIILNAPNLGWNNVEIKSYLEDNFGCPAYIMNDVDAGVYGEYRMGAGKNARCVIGVFPGTGIGGGCVYNGQLIRGDHASCFELGHIKVLEEGPVCGCGRRGCLEAVASRLAIAQQAAAAAFRGQAPNLLAEAGTELLNIRSSTLARSIEAGDEVIERIVRDAATWLGIGIANLINLLSPDVIVLGGGLVEALPDLFMEEVSQAVETHIMPAFLKTYKLKIAKLGDYATVSGAAAYALDLIKKTN